MEDFCKGCGFVVIGSRHRNLLYLPLNITLLERFFPKAIQAYLKCENEKEALFYRKNLPGRMVKIHV